MLPDKVKLLPESKRTFLEFGLKRVFDKQESASEEQIKSWMYYFVKMLCISRSYLYCFYRTDPDIYRLNLCFTQNSDSITVSFASKDYNFSGENSASLSYHSVYTLVKLLLPSYVGASFDYSFADALAFERSLEILKLTKGKIGLKLGDDELKKQSVQTSLKNFAARTYVLDCSIERFESIESLQFPTFDCLSISLIENSDQILRVLKCKAKELELLEIDEDFTIEDGDLVNSKNETITNLHLSFDEVYYDVEIEELVKQLHKCCSSLKHFNIEAEFLYEDEASVNQIPDRIFAYVERMNNLKACLGNGLINAHIYFHVPIYLNARRDNSWINVISNKPELKHWKVESHEEHLDQEGFGDFLFQNVLEMEFDDTRCNLEMTIDVFTRGAENDDQGFDDEDMDFEE